VIMLDAPAKQADLCQPGSRSPRSCSSPPRQSAHPFSRVRAEAGRVALCPR
jgi:hypothetical protein